MPSTKARPVLETRERLKRVAMELYGSRDPDSVSVREIARAAHQKNASVVSYYFGSKEALLRELILDVSAVADVDRRRHIQRIETAGGPHSIREVVSILMRDPRSAFDSEPSDGAQGPFIDMMLSRKSDLLFETIGPELGPGTHACLDHLRRLLPELPEPILSQRLRLALLLGFTTLSSRRDALSHPHLWPARWLDDLAQENLIDTVVGMLREPVSFQTTAVLEG